MLPAAVGVLANAFEGIWSAVPECSQGMRTCLRFALDCDFFDVNYCDKIGKVTAVHVCAQNNSTNCLALLINRNADLDKQEKANGNTPLHCAVLCNDYPADTVQLLLQSGANYKAQNRKKRTPLQTAKSKYFKSVSLEIEKVKERSVPQENPTECQSVETAGKPT